MLVRTSFVVLGKKSFFSDLSIDDQGNFSLCIFYKATRKLFAFTFAVA